MQKYNKIKKIKKWPLEQYLWVQYYYGKKKRPYKGEDYMKNRALLGSIAMEIMKTCKDCNPKLRAAIFIKNQENVKDNKIDLNEVAAYGGYFHSIHDVNEFLMIMSALLKIN